MVPDEMQQQRVDVELDERLVSNNPIKIHRTPAQSVTSVPES